MHIYTRGALLENIRRFSEIISLKCVKGSQNDKWINIFYKGMTHIVNVVCMYKSGRITDEQFMESMSRQYYTTDFIDRCSEKLFEFTAMVDKHFDGTVGEDVKRFDTPDLAVCSPKLIEYVGQNLIRRIMFVAVSNEIIEMLKTNPELLPYPTIKEDTEEMFYLRTLLSSVYTTIVRTLKDKPVLRTTVLRSYVQVVISIVPFWQVIQLMKYPFTKRKTAVKQDDVIVETEHEGSEQDGVEHAVEEVQLTVPEKDSDMVDVNALLDDEVSKKTFNAARNRPHIPSFMMARELKWLISKRLTEEKQRYQKEVEQARNSEQTVVEQVAVDGTTELSNVEGNVEPTIEQPTEPTIEQTAIEGATEQ